MSVSFGVSLPLGMRRVDVVFAVPIVFHPGKDVVPSVVLHIPFTVADTVKWG